MNSEGGVEIRKIWKQLIDLTCLAVNPLDNENSDPFSTIYALPHTLHFSASEDSAYCWEIK